MAVGDPDIAGDMAGIMMDAAMANPDMAENFVGEIAGGMAAGAPQQAGEIAVGMMEANPDMAGDIAGELLLVIRKLLQV